MDLTPFSLGRPQDRAPRPPARDVFTNPVHLVAFGFGAGLSPNAPGTVGTLWGVAAFLLLGTLPLWAYLAATLALFGFGCWVCGRSAALLGTPDHSGIVFDEIVGYLVAATPLLWNPAGPALVWVIAAFVLFRVFDIAKPWPIRRLDASVHGGFGIMLDDLVAGIYAAVPLGIACRIL